MTQSSGTAATSVEIWAVTATRRPEGTAASATQRAIWRGRGGAISVPSTVAATGGASGAFHNSAPQAAISSDQHDEAQRPQPGLIAELGSTVRSVRDMTAAQGSCRHCWRRRENTDLWPPGGRCARTRPAATGCWPRARGTAARSTPQTSRAARMPALSSAAGPIHWRWRAAGRSRRRPSPRGE